MAEGNSSGGASGGAGGAGGQGNSDGASGDHSEGGGGTVAYETHRKLLSEKKRLQDQFEQMKTRIDDIEREKADAEKKKLEEQGEFKKLLELEREKSTKLATDLARHDEQTKAARKLDSVLKAIDGEIPTKYWGLIDLNGVVVNPETGEIDQMSVTKAVEEIRKNYPEIIFSKSAGVKGPMPNNAPKPGNGTLSYDQWKTIKSAKEMKEKWSQVDPKTIPQTA